MNMLLGFLLSFLMYLSPVVLYKAGNDISNNKFLITDGIYRKLPNAKTSKNDTNNKNTNNKDSLRKVNDPNIQAATTKLPDSTITHSMRDDDDDDTDVLSSSHAGLDLEPVPMNQISPDSSSIQGGERNNITGKNAGMVNHEHLIGQIIHCDTIYKGQCGGSQCVQILEGAKKCVVDMCQGKMLIACRNGQGCYTQSQYCDGITDCEDRSDEMNCMSLVQAHNERHFYTRTVPFMAILCLMGVAASFVLYHQTNAARQRQRHLSMVGLTNALTSAGIAQGMDRPMISGRSWRLHDGPETGLLRDFHDPIHMRDPIEPSATGGMVAPQQLGGDVRDFQQHIDSPASRLLAGVTDTSSNNQPPSSRPPLLSLPQTFLQDSNPNPGRHRTFSGRSYFGYCGSGGGGYGEVAGRSRSDSGGAPPPYETALEMGTIKDNTQGQYEPQDSEASSSYGDPPPYESVSHITCTSIVPVTDV